MKRFLFLIILCAGFGYSAHGQDLIVTNTGDSLKCKIVDIKENVIQFRYDELGQIITISRSDVFFFKHNYYKGRSKASGSFAIRGRSELSVYAGGGLSGLNYTPDIGSRSLGFGGLFGFGYTYFISGRWGLVTGVEAALYRAEYSIDKDYSGSYQAVSGTSQQSGDDFTFSYAYVGYKEKQSALFLQIPVMLQYQTGRFYAAAGVKVGFPINTACNISAASLATQGYFPAENQTYKTLPDRGMGTYEGFSNDGDFEAGINCSAAVEAGMQWFLGQRTNLYVGAYFDYGLNNIGKSGTGRPVEYTAQAADKLEFNGIVNTIDKINTMAVGIKVKITYGL